MPSSSTNPADLLLIQRIRDGDEDAWDQLIQRFEGRLLAFVRSRLRNSTASEDIVQEAFMGFLISLPNYDDRTPLETYLFSIAAHKLTDHLRREGRRPTVPLQNPASSSGPPEPVGPARRASSLVRGQEQRDNEQLVLASCIAELIAHWRGRGDFLRLKVMELLLVKGFSNKLVAQTLGITEQDVANHKHYVLQKLSQSAQARLSTFRLADYGLEA